MPNIHVVSAPLENRREENIRVHQEFLGSLATRKLTGKAAKRITGGFNFTSEELPEDETGKIQVPDADIYIVGTPYVWDNYYTRDFRSVIIKARERSAICLVLATTRITGDDTVNKIILGSFDSVRLAVNETMKELIYRNS